MAKIVTEFSFKDNVSAGLGKVRQSAENAAAGFSKVATTLLSVNSAIQIFSAVSAQFNKIKESVAECTTAYQYQSEQELKLATIMRQRLGATNDEIQSIKDFASEQQKIGIYGDEIILQGAQELASFTSNTEAIKTLIPAMNNLIAQQYGYSASGQQFQSTADMMGKVLSGQTGALSKLGYVFSDEEKAMLEAGDEMQRAATLAKIITDNVGNMNEALRGTEAGQMQDLANYIGDLKEEIGGTLMSLKSATSSLTSTITADFLTMVNNILKRIVPVINRIIKAFQDIYNKARPFLQKIADFMINVIGKAIDFVVQNLNTIVTAITIVATVMVAKALAMAAAWVVMNWQVVLIVAALVLLVKILESFGIGLEEIGKYVGGAFATAFVTVYNIVADVYNLFVSVGELIANITRHPVKALANFLADIFATVYDGLATVAGLIDGIGAVIGKDWNVSGIFNDIANSIRAAKDTEDMITFTRMDKITGADLTANVNKGMALGAKIGAGMADATKMVQDAYNGVTQDAAIQEDIEAGLVNAMKINGDGSVSVKDKGLVDIAADYKELLSQQATEKFNLRFSQVTPNVTFGDVNINSEKDGENIFEKIVGKMEELESSYLGG